MARKPRVHYKGALYHVIVRGNNKSYIFEKDEEKYIYKSIIKKYKDKYSFLIYAYCIMDNHAHMLIEANDTELSKIMQGIQQVYTQKYNKKYKRTGHVFEQRYKAILCNKDNYLLELIRYIHQNPLKANISDTLTYKWSSHSDYTEKEDIVDTNLALSLFSENKKEATKRYLAFMGVLDKKAYLEYALDEEMLEVQNEEKKDIERVGKEEYFEKVKEYYKIDLLEFRRGRLTKRERMIRTTILLLCKEISDVSNKELSELFGITPSGITKILSRTEYNDIKEEYEELKMSICQA